MPKSPDQIAENIDFAAEEVAEAAADRREFMLEEIAKSLTRKLLQDTRRMDVHEISERVTRFVKAVRQRVEELHGSRNTR